MWNPNQSMKSSDMLYLHFTELHKIKIPSICLWLNFILILTLLSPARAPAHSSRAASTALGGSYHSTSIRLIFSIFLSPIFFLFVCLVCFFIFLKVSFWGRGCCGEGCETQFLCSASGVSIAVLRRKAPHSLVQREGCKVTCTYFYYHPKNFFPAPSPLCLAHPSSVFPPSCAILLPFLLHCPFALPNWSCSSLVPQHL